MTSGNGDGFRWRRPRTLRERHSIDDLRSLGRRKLPAPVFHHLDGAAETETTALRNVRAFDEHELIPRCLVAVSIVRTRTRVLGQEIEWPVICGPTGASRFFHPQDEQAVARAAESVGTLYGLSMVATSSLEDVAVATAAPKFFQLYIFKNRDVTRDLIERCKRARYAALCLTIDVPVTAMQFGRISMPNVAPQCGSQSLMVQTQFITEQLDASVSWRDVRQMIELWQGSFAIKGIMSADDARCAADIGATAIVVSNHGGRQLDGAAASVDLLPEITRAVGSRVDVILDGIRRGVHVLKALALGAKACFIGRAYLYGLAAGGKAGVTHSLEILRTELVRTMRLSGSVDVTYVDPTLVGRRRAL